MKKGVIMFRGDGGGGGDDGVGDCCGRIVVIYCVHLDCEDGSRLWWKMWISMEVRRRPILQSVDMPLKLKLKLSHCVV